MTTTVRDIPANVAPEWATPEELQFANKVFEAIGVPPGTVLFVSPTNGEFVGMASKAVPEEDLYPDKMYP